MASVEVPPNARAAAAARGHRFAAYPRCSTDSARSGDGERPANADATEGSGSAELSSSRWLRPAYHVYGGAVAVSLGWAIQRTAF
jgi:hypothetical protein